MPPKKYTVKKKYTKKPNIAPIIGQRIPQSAPKYSQQYPDIQSQHIDTLPDSIVTENTNIPFISIPNESLEQDTKCHDLSCILNKNTLNNPYECKKDIVTHVHDGRLTAVTQTVTCKCNGPDCIDTTNTNTLASIFSGGAAKNINKLYKRSRKKKDNRKNKHIRIKSANITRNHVKNKKKNNNQDINTLFTRVQIDPSKITNKHCSRYGTVNTPYHFTDIFDVIHTPSYDPLSTKIDPNNINPYMENRALILSEIQVLLRFYDTNKIKHPTILYICTSSGIHLITLANMFPMVKFIVYGDELHPLLHAHPKFIVHDNTTRIFDKNRTDTEHVNNGIFTTGECERLSEQLNKNELIFICNTRFVYNQKDIFEFQRKVLNDMRIQEKYMQILQPILSLVKFRLPLPIWPKNNNMTYLRGDILYGIWADITSKETRLLIPQKNIVNNATEDYKIDHFYDGLSYHNTYTRTVCQAWIPQPFHKYIMAKDNIYCSCYDCIAELNILYEYAIRFNNPFDDIIQAFGKEMNTNKKVTFQKGE